MLGTDGDFSCTAGTLPAAGKAGTSPHICQSRRTAGGPQANPLSVSVKPMLVKSLQSSWRTDGEG